MTKEPFTAADAREMMRFNDPEFHVDKILDSVRQAAKAGQSSTQYRESGFGEGRLYNKGPDELQKRIMEKLSALGFSVQIRFEERQLVDIYLLIDWSEK